MNERGKPELLAPAGNFEKLKSALHYGADAVYAGLSQFSLRAQTGEFSEEDLREWILHTRSMGRKIYVTTNIYAHNRDLEALKEHALFLNEVRPDAVIVSDAGVFDMMATHAPGVPLHISTQANITNKAAARFWQRMGAERIVLARELSLDEIRELREEVSLELESFVHGAICIAYSGRCYISSFINNRSGNRGECTNSCRWNYFLMEEKRPNEYFPVFENDRGTHIMSSKDLCLLDYLKELREAGVDSFKIEGRMKGINYVSGVVKVYREAIDSLEDGTGPESLEQWREELTMFSNRGFTTGMALGKQPDEDYNHDSPPYVRSEYELGGVVESLEGEFAFVALRNTIRTGDRIRFLTPGLEEASLELEGMEDLSGTMKDVGKNGERVRMRVLSGVREGDLIRVKKRGERVSGEWSRV